ncbi:MAG: ATP-binding protein [Vicinamibacterales bacterium]
MDIETFAHVVAHDLKAPLNGIASMVDFFVEDYAARLDDEGREQLRLIQQMAERGVAMVDGLRRFSRIAEAAVQPRRLDLTAMATRAVTRAAALVPDATVRAHVAPLPAVLGDPALVPDLLDAICSNAVRFHTGTLRDVTVAPLAAPPASPPDGHVAIGVTDTGIGIEARYHDAVFDMFKRLHAPYAYGGGVGAGLAVARAIVERHGGRIWIAGSSSAGTTIAFTLPAVPAEA